MGGVPQSQTFMRKASMQSSFSGPNAALPHQMPADARLYELGRILAAGVLRMREQSSSLSAAGGDSSLGSPATKSVSRPRARARTRKDD